MRLLALAASAALCASVSTASASPIVRSADLTLTLSLTVASETISVSAPASVTVDETAQTITVAAGALTGSAGPVPVASNTGILALSITGLSNAAGAFSIGGAAGFETPCPGGSPASGVACAAGIGLGGGLNFAGNLLVDVGAVTYALPLATGGAFGTDFAAFTRFTAYVGTTFGTVTQLGSTSAAASSLSLVSPVAAVPIGMERTLTIAFTDGGGLPSFVNATVPEPATLALLAAGAVGLLATRPRR